LGVLLIALFIAGPQKNVQSSASPLAPATASYQAEILSNSQFVFGPSARRFDIAGYLSRADSPLLADSPLIEQWCGYASVNPRVILAVLEMDGRVTHGWPSSLSSAQRARLIEAMIIRLAERFYWHLYQDGERGPQPSPMSVQVPLADGRWARLASASSGTYAVLELLGRERTAAEFERLVDTHDSESFIATWVRLFPGVDPLDASHSITPAALPPADLFQFPFPVGQTWRFNGAHNWNGSGVTYGKPYSSMDFFTSASSCSSPPAGDWAVAAAGGSGYRPGGYSCWYRVDHAGGWTTSYYHLRNTVPGGSIGANGAIGTIACETCAGGFATGPHVHFSLLYNGAYVDLEGVKLSGWTVRSGNGDYQTGGLERDGVMLQPYSSVLNQGLPAGPATPTPTRTATPALEVSPSPTSPVTPSATPSGTVATYTYPPANGLVRICPVKLVADVAAPAGVNTVRFWAKVGAAWQQVGSDSDGSNGWQAEWDCQDAPDGSAALRLSVEDAAGREVIKAAGTTPVTLRKDCPNETYRTAFFANPVLDGAPASSWCKASAISYAWGTGSPGAGVPGDDNFSARFRGLFPFDGGAYRFSGNFDDGIRVWVDRSLAYDRWRVDASGAKSFQFVRAMSAGTHEIRLDYYEDVGSASVALQWEKTGDARVPVFLPLVLSEPR
jgi:murein DD-endopeptidase MepM/ murein hydrolase activator NlpD